MSALMPGSKCPDVQTAACLLGLFVFVFLRGENGISFVDASLCTRFHRITAKEQKPLKVVTMAKPTSAFLRAGPSLVPSPVTATTCRVSPTVLSMIPEQGETKQMFSVRAEMNKGFPVVRAGRQELC